MIPDFNDNGDLPPGEYLATLSDIKERYAANATRRRQFDGFERAVRALAAAGCPTVWLDGSYITDEPEPGDFDATFDGESIDWVALGLAEPELLDLEAPRRTQKRVFSGELVPTLASGVDFVEFFQTSRDGNPKGIIRLDLMELT